jgi:HEPN domain-containing protein
MIKEIKKLADEYVKAGYGKDQKRDQVYYGHRMTKGQVEVAKKIKKLIPVK